MASDTFSFEILSAVLAGGMAMCMPCLNVIILEIIHFEWQRSMRSHAIQVKLLEMGRFNVVQHSQYSPFLIIQ